MVISRVSLFVCYHVKLSKMHVRLKSFNKTPLIEEKKMFLIHNLLPSKFAVLTAFREVKTRGTTGSQSRNNYVN